MMYGTHFSRMWLQAALLGVVVEAAVPVFKLGACWGYFNDMGVVPWATKIAFDEGFFDDILPNKNFKVEMQGFDAECDGTVAASRILPVLVGSGKQAGRFFSETTLDPVIAIAGCTCSGATMGAQPLAGAYKVPMVSGSATNPQLSNKLTYPYFARTFPADDIQSAGFAALADAFNWKRIVATYLQDTYGSGIAFAFRDAVKAGVEVFMVPHPVTPPRSAKQAAGYDYKQMDDMARRVTKFLPLPRIFLFSGNVMAFTTRAFYEAGLINSKTAWMVCENLCMDGIYTDVSNNIGDFVAADPTRAAWWNAYDWPKMAEYHKGLYCLLPKTSGPRFDLPSFQNLWKSLTIAKLKAAGLPDSVDVANPKTFRNDVKYFTDNVYNTYAIDAMTAIIYSISSMLQENVPVEEIIGEKLMAKIMKVKFTGLSGDIAFNKNGDRLAPYMIKNMQISRRLASDDDHRRLAAPSNLQRVGLYDGASGTINWDDAVDGKCSKCIFADGTNNIPSDRPPTCPAGMGVLNGECRECPAGTHKPSSLIMTCLACAKGRFSAGTGAIDCTSCAVGTYLNATGGTGCSKCPEGTFAGKEGTVEYTPCPAGTFAASPGLQKCERCPVGTYTSMTGNTDCVSCQAEIKGSSTLFQGAADKGDCKCMKGSYDGEVLHNSKSCVGCDEGLQCDEAGLRKPYQAKGYYIDGANTKAVYLCSPPEACEGGDWAASVCRAPRTGFLCMTCPKGLTLNSDLDDASAKGCKECVWIASVILALAPIVVFCCLLAVIYHTHHNALDDDVVFTEAQNTIGQLIMFVQVTNACFSTRVKYGEPVLSFVDEVFAQLDPDKVLSNAPCLSEFMKEPVTQYAITITSPMIMIGCLFAAYFISLLGCNGKLMFDGVFNVVGEVLVEFYISVTLAIFAPFDCYDHPNGAKSVQKFPKIICGEGDHGAMMGLAVIGILAYPVNAICVSLYHTWQLPRSMAANANELRILIRCHFLFGRWKPETCWFCNVTIIRNFFFAVFPMIMPQDQLDVTIVLMIVTLMTALVLTVWFKPRRNIMQNVLDTFISAVQLIITTFGLSSVHGQSVSESLSGFLLILMALVITAVMSLMVLKAFQLLHPAGKAQVQYAVYLCHHAGAGGAAARVLHSMLLKAIKGRIFYDIDNLSNDTKLIDSIKVSNNLVVVFGSETLCRTWCIGAIVAAYRKSIPMQTVVFTDPLPEETVCGDAPNSSYVKKSFGASSTKASKKSMVEVDTTPLRGHGVDQRFAHPAIDALMQLDPTLLNLLSEREMNTNFQTILDAMPRCERGTPVDVVVSSVFRPATTPKEPNLPGGMLILIDQMDGEAVAVCRLMRAVFSLTGTCLQDQDIPPNEYAKVAKGQNVETAIFLLTARTLTCGVQLSRFALLWKNKPSVHVVPVVVGLTFDFPDQDYLSNLQLGRVLALGSSPAERLASFAGDMVSLKMIADSLTHVMTFLVIFINVANLTQVKLDKAMADVLDRVHNKTGRRASFHGEKAEALVAPEPVASQEAAIDIDV